MAERKGGMIILLLCGREAYDYIERHFCGDNHRTGFVTTELLGIKMVVNPLLEPDQVIVVDDARSVLIPKEMEVDGFCTYLSEILDREKEERG